MTVPRRLNDPDQVSEEMRRRVGAADDIAAFLSQRVAGLALHDTSA